MARRRAKSLKKYKKNKKQLGAAISYIAGHYAEEDPSKNIDDHQSEIEKDLSKYKKDLSEIRPDQKNPPCQDAKVAWYEDSSGDSTLKPELNVNSSKHLPNITRSAFTYPGSKNNIKNQIVPIIGQLRDLAKTDRHIEGFLGGAGSFVSFPLDFTKKSVAIEYKPNVARAHKGFIKGCPTCVSDIRACASTGVFNNFKKYGSQKEYDDAIDDGKESGNTPGKATTDPCEAYISTKIVQVNSVSDKQDAFFRQRYSNAKSKKEEFSKIMHQENVYSRPDVKIVQGSFLDYLDGSLKDGNKSNPIMPLQGDLIYMDPPYLGTEEQYGKAKKSCDDKEGEDFKECTKSEFPKFEVPDDEKSCGYVPGDNPKLKEFPHRTLWTETAAMYERMNDPKFLRKGKKGVHIAISHSAEGRFHCLIKNSFKKAIARGEFKACRIDVKRTSSKSRGFFDLPYKDELKEQEWLMIISPQAKNIKCDEVPISSINKDKDKSVRIQMINESCKRKECRAAIGNKYLSDKVSGMEPNKATKFLMESSNNKCPPAKMPEWINDYREVKQRLDTIRKNRKCGKKYDKFGPSPGEELDIENMEIDNECD